MHRNLNAMPSRLTRFAEYETSSLENLEVSLSCLLVDEAYVLGAKLQTHGKKKGRELNAPPLEAPRSALDENTPSRARWARARSVSSN